MTDKGICDTLVHAALMGLGSFGSTEKSAKEIRQSPLHCIYLIHSGYLMRFRKLQILQKQLTKRLSILFWLQPILRQERNSQTPRLFRYRLIHVIVSKWGL